MSRLDDIEQLYETAEYREATVADIPYLIRVARAAERYVSIPLDEGNEAEAAYHALRDALAGKEDGR